MLGHSVRFVAQTAVVAVALACRDSAPTALSPARPTPFVILTPDSQTVQVPRTLQLAWRGGRDFDTVTWESSNDIAASVSTSGVIAAKFPGSTTITARRGRESATLTVIATAATVEISPGVTVLRLDGRQSLTATVRDANGAALIGVLISWNTDNANVVTVDTRTGALTPIAKGAATIFAAGGGANGTALVYVELTGEPLRLSTIGSISNHACALEAPTGFAYCWGDNHAGALGMGEGEAWDRPALVNGGRRFNRLSVGAYATCGIEAVTAVAYCWGANRFGDLGDDTYTTRSEPTLVADQIRFTSISTSGTHTCGVEAQTGRGYCWGKERLVGDGSGLSRLTPTIVGTEERRIIFSEISAGWSHTCGLEERTGAAFCWGSNAGGQLGDGTTIDRLAPQPVATPALRFISISAGWTLSCGVANTGLGYCWGSNPFGQIGDGTTANRLVPTLVGTGRQRFSSISATGGANACGLEAQTGLAYCWGRDIGEAGDSISAYLTHPTPVRGTPRRFSSIVATYGGGCGVEADTEVGYCWTYSQMIPVPILPPLSPTLAPLE